MISVCWFIQGQYNLDLREKLHVHRHYVSLNSRISFSAKIRDLQTFIFCCSLLFVDKCLYNQTLYVPDTVELLLSSLS